MVNRAIRSGDSRSRRTSPALPKPSQDATAGAASTAEVAGFLPSGAHDLR